MKKTKVAFVLLQDYPLMSAAAAVEPLRAANLLSGRDLYEIGFVSIAGGAAKASVGSAFPTIPLSRAGTDFGLVFVVAGGNPFEIAEPRLDAWLRRLDRAGVRLGGISGGVAILVAAGLMARRRLTIHWHHYDALLERHPDAMLERRLFVIDRNRCSCAGGVAALDMMHALMAEEHGATFAREVSDWYLHTHIRPPHDPQRARPAEKYGLRHTALAAAVELMETHIADPLSPDQTAALCQLSSRHLHRLFKHELGETFTTFYSKLRIQKAKELLRQTALSIAEVGWATGYTNPSHFTREFRARAGVTPTVFKATRP